MKDCKGFTHLLWLKSKQSSGAAGPVRTSSSPSCSVISDSVPSSWADVCIFTWLGCTLSDCVTGKTKRNPAERQSLRDWQFQNRQTEQSLSNTNMIDRTTSRKRCCIISQCRSLWTVREFWGDKSACPTLWMITFDFYCLLLVSFPATWRSELSSCCWVNLMLRNVLNLSERIKSCQ